MNFSSFSQKNKLVLTIGGLLFLTVVTLVNVWVAKKTTQPITTQAQSELARLSWLPANHLEVKEGQSFEVDLNFTSERNLVSALDIGISYNSEILTLQTYSLNEEIGIFPVQKSEEGRLSFSALPKDFATNPGFSSSRLAKLTFVTKTLGETDVSIDPSSIAAYAGKNFLVLDTDSKLKVEIK